MKQSPLTLAIFVSGTLVAAAAPATSPPDSLLGQCETCHGDGPGGRTDAARLNGLSSAYIFSRLDAFANPLMQAPHAIENMTSTVINMDDATKHRLADYFAAQPAAPVKLGEPMAGKNLYERGIPAQGVAACQTCHGAGGEGEGNAPRLAGQKREYLKLQLWAFNLVARVHGAMNAGAMKFSSDDIDALASYLSGK